ILWVIDGDARATYVNPQIARLGYKPEDVLGRRPRELMTPASRELATATFQRGMSGELDRVRYEVEFLAADGSIVPFEISSASLRDGAGRPTGRVVVLRDVSDRRRAEEALRESEERFRSIAETADDVIWVVDQQGRIRYSN